METLSLAFIGHMVGDFLLQTDWMAENKKNAFLPCFVHAVLYTASIAFFTGWGFYPALIIFVFHFLQDRTKFVAYWMAHTGQKGFAEPPLSPWSMIVVDNTFHFLQIWLVWKLIEMQILH